MPIDILSLVSEIRWCGIDFPDCHADSEGRVYHLGNEVQPHIQNKKKPYPQISIHGKQFKVHALVCSAFHGPRPVGLECRHLNDVKTDNRADNLRWGTTSENRRDAIRNGLNRPVLGALNFNARLTEDDVRAIRRAYDGHRYEGGSCSQSALAAQYGVSQPAISSIVLRKTWKHVADEEPAS